MRSKGFFYNLAGFVFEYFCDSRRILATFTKFCLNSLFATWSYRYPNPKHVIQRALELSSISHTCFFDLALARGLRNLVSAKNVQTLRFRQVVCDAFTWFSNILQIVDCQWSFLYLLCASCEAFACTKKSFLWYFEMIQKIPFRLILISVSQGNYWNEILENPRSFWGPLIAPYYKGIDHSKESSN